MISEQVGREDDPAEDDPPLAEKTSPGHNLSVLARTSKMFLDPALNDLWRHQDTIVNLLNCMPDDLWYITETPSFGEDWNDQLRLTIVRTCVDIFYRPSTGSTSF